MNPSIAASIASIMITIGSMGVMIVLTAKFAIGAKRDLDEINERLSRECGDNRRDINAHRNLIHEQAERLRRIIEK